MNRRIRRRSTNTSYSYLRYLKPGALAKLRDSKINAKSHHRSSDSQIYLHCGTSTSPVSTSSPSRSSIVSSVSSEQATGTFADADGGSPCFSVRYYGPRCPQRKKLIAARSMCFFNSNGSGMMLDGPEPATDAFSNVLLIDL